MSVGEGVETGWRHQRATAATSKGAGGADRTPSKMLTPWPGCGSSPGNVMKRPAKKAVITSTRVRTGDMPEDGPFLGAISHRSDSSRQLSVSERTGVRLLAPCTAAGASDAPHRTKWNACAKQRLHPPYQTSIPD